MQKNPHGVLRRPQGQEVRSNGRLSKHVAPDGLYEAWPIWLPTGCRWEWETLAFAHGKTWSAIGAVGLAGRRG